MLEFFTGWDGLPYVPHGHCYLWQPGLVGLHVLSDSLTAIAYYSIPISLLYLVRTRQDLPFNQVFWLFSLFIIACGATHGMAVWTIWHPNYWIYGVVKAFTAVVSVYTALELIPLIPQALALPNPAQLEQANQELAHEITERKHIEDILREGKARYLAILQDQTELIARFQPDGTLTFINEAYCRYFGQSRDRLINNTYKPFIFSEDQERINQMLEGLTCEHPVATIEHRVVVNDEVRWMQWVNRAIFNPDGDFVEFQSVGRDISDRKQTEIALQESQRFIQKIADTAPVFLYVYDFIEHHTIYRNRHIANLLGYTPSEIQALEIDPVHLMYFQGQTPTDFPATRWQTVPDDGALQSEHSLTHRDGSCRYFQCQETLFARMEDGTPRQILGIAVDVTATKQVEALRKSEEKLHLSLQEKDVLLKELHHRVKNNLQMVYSLLRLQSRRTKQTEAKATLRESQNRIKSIALIHEKLYCSERLTAVDLRQYIPKLVTNLVSSYELHPNAIALNTQVDNVTLDIDTAIPCGLIVNELVSNALKYAFPDGQPGTLDTLLQVNPDHSLTLTIRDNGRGMPNSFHADTSESLGLKLVQDLVEQLNGSMEIICHPGTTFKITFPWSSE